MIYIHSSTTLCFVNGCNNKIFKKFNSSYYNYNCIIGVNNSLLKRQNKSSNEEDQNLLKSPKKKQMLDSNTPKELQDDFNPK